MKTTIDKPPGESSPFHCNSILAPTDFSAPSKHAVATAVHLAGLCGATITLLHVIVLPAAQPVEAALNVEEFANAAHESLEGMAREIPAALLREKLVRMEAQGTVQGIIAAARELSVDLIVVATHGHGRLERAVLGSTAEKVVRHAPCPVWVVRQKKVVSESNQTSKT